MGAARGPEGGHVGCHDEGDGGRTQDDVGLETGTAAATPRACAEFGDRAVRPALRKMAEDLLEGQRHLDVGEGVPAERREGVLLAHGGAPQHVAERGGDAVVERVGPGLLHGHRGQRAIVGLAVRQPGHLGRCQDRDAGGRKPEVPRERRNHAGGDAPRDGDDHPLVGPRARRGHALPREDPLDLVEVDPEPEELQEATAAADDLDQARGAEAGEVARWTARAPPCRGPGRRGSRRSRASRSDPGRPAHRPLDRATPARRGSRTSRPGWAPPRPRGAAWPGPAAGTPSGPSPPSARTSPRDASRRARRGRRSGAPGRARGGRRPG